VSDADREKWDRKSREAGAETTAPSAFLVGLDALLPRAGRALDVAGGAGRNAVWLAARGLEVTLADVSRAGLALAEAAARAAGVRLETRLLDLDRDPLPAGPFDVVLSFNFLRRDLLPAYGDRLAPGGLLVYLQATRTNLERHARPPAGFLLADGELANLVAAVPALEIVSLEERWFPAPDPQAAPRHEARLLARRR